MMPENNIEQPKEDNVDILLNMSQQVEDLKARVATLEADPADAVEIKNTTGDFADADSWNGRRVINTVDNDYRIFTEGSWRSIITW